MLFNSYIFIFIFLPFGVIFYYTVFQRFEKLSSNIFILLMSLFFYGYWNPFYTLIIVSSIIINYICGILIIRNNEINLQSRIILSAGILFNLSILFYYKYSYFIFSNINALFSFNIPLENIILPLAVSFFTFQQIAYLVDAYSGHIDNEKNNLLSYACFVSFFPQLIAGPIVHHSEIMHQLLDEKKKKVNYRNMSLGLFSFSIGLFKKVILADTLAKYVVAGFDGTAPLTFFEAWMSSLSYTFQLYFDFSGYTDMAIGAALFFNITLPINFNSPYKTTSLSSFWNNWHMTLSRFVNAYIFMPLLKLRTGYSFRYTLFCLFLSLTVMGLWHGAAWSFIIFGMCHGAGVGINHVWKKKVKLKISPLVGCFLTFMFFNCTIVLFRSHNNWAIFNVFSGMLGLNGFVLPSFLGNWSFLFPESVAFGGVFTHINGDVKTLFWILFSAIIVFGCPNSNYMRETFKCEPKRLLFSVLIFGLSVLNLSSYSEFLYFDF